MSSDGVYAEETAPLNAGRVNRASAAVKIPTETEAGLAWVDKYLHPPSVPKSSFCGCPDTNISPFTLLNFQTITNIPLTVVISGKTYNVSQVMVMQTSGARVIAWVFVRIPDYNKNEWLQHPQMPAILNDSYDFVRRWGKDVSMVRMSYKSCTYYLNSTAFNNQGTVTIAQFRPNILTGIEPDLPPTDLPVEHIESQLSDVDDEHDHLSDDRPRFEVKPRIGPDTNYNSQVFNAADVSGGNYFGAYVPSTPTMIQQMSPKATTHLAREGAFVPQHWSQPVNMFYRNPAQNGNNEDALVHTYIDNFSADGSSHRIRLFTKMNSDGTLPTKPTLDNNSDTVWTDFTWSYAYFDALTAIPTNSTQTSIVSPAYITVKCIYGLEVQPHPKSAFVFFQMPAPVPDDRALHAAAAIVHQMPDGYPAVANSLGSIAAMALQYAPKVVNWLQNAFVANAPSKAAVQEVKAEVKAEVQKDIVPVVAATAPTDLTRRIAQLTNQVNQLKVKRTGNAGAAARVNRAFATGRYGRNSAPPSAFRPYSRNNNSRAGTSGVSTPMAPIGTNRSGTVQPLMGSNTPVRSFSTRLR